VNWLLTRLIDAQLCTAEDVDAAQVSDRIREYFGPRTLGLINKTTPPNARVNFLFNYIILTEINLLIIICPISDVKKISEIGKNREI
jgi:hypothetical protein